MYIKYDNTFHTYSFAYIEFKSFDVYILNKHFTCIGLFNFYLLINYTLLFYIESIL